MQALPDDNLCYPVLLEIGNSTGSGFYFRTGEKVFLVTALHVVFQGATLKGPRLKLLSYDSDRVIDEPIEMVFDLDQLLIRKNERDDVVLIELGSIPKGDKGIVLNKGVTRTSERAGTIVVVPSENLKKFVDVLVSNEVFVLGYPNSLNSNGQIDPKRPLLRKGIVAGKNIERQTIILDCPVYFDNSGGLAIEVEDKGLQKIYKVIGVVSQFIPFVDQLESIQLGYTNLSIENSGYSVVVPIDTLSDLAKETPMKSTEGV